MSQEAHLSVVRRFFNEVIDARSGSLAELFSLDCVVHRPELPEPLRGIEQLRSFLEKSFIPIQKMHTTLHHLIAEGEYVAARLSHQVTFSGPVTTPLGARDVTGQSFEWSAMALFRMADGRIAEEWVHRDEMGFLIQLGLVERS